METIEDVLAQARDAEATTEEYLVDDGWKAVEVESVPEMVGVNGTNGHHEIFGVGPTVDPVPDSGHPPVKENGHAQAPIKGNGHQEEAEPQRSLFSWAESMAEDRVKTKGRRRKSQPATISMFEWALTLEQKREAEPVGTGR